LAAGEVDDRELPVIPQVLVMPVSPICKSDPVWIRLRHYQIPKLTMAARGCQVSVACRTLRMRAHWGSITGVNDVDEV